MSSGFPTLQPAFIIILSVASASQIGTVASGSSLTIFTTTTGTLISVPGFTPQINASLVFGADHLYHDPDGSKIRVNISGAVKTDDDIMLGFKYHGTYHLTDAMKQAFAGNAKEGKMPFGQSTLFALGALARFIITPLGLLDKGRVMASVSLLGVHLVLTRVVQFLLVPLF